MALEIDRDTLQRVIARDSATSSDFDLNPMAAPKGAKDLRDAGVLAAFIERAYGPNLILTKRASHLNHHPGQVAFPGGRRDDEDRDVVDTALREAREEIGLAAETVEVLGRLPYHVTVSNYAMTPVLGWIRDDFVPELEVGEVAECFEVPASFVLDLENFRVQSRRWQGRMRSYYTVPYGPYYIWGATARVLYRLAEGVAACRG